MEEKVSVKVKLQDVVKEEVLPSPKVVPSVAEKKPKPEKKPKSERQPVKKPAVKSKEVLGLNPDAVLTPKNAADTRVAVPLGNTLMATDKGIRLKKEQVDALEKDLSRQAELIRTTLVKPKYTDEALDAGLEGVFVVDVFVDEAGTVVDAEMAEKIGLGMDRLVLNAAKNARFYPRKDKTGKSISGWTSLRFLLEIE